jgi:hypothetical protein
MNGLSRTRSYKKKRNSNKNTIMPRTIRNGIKNDADIALSVHTKLIMGKL